MCSLIHRIRKVQPRVSFVVFFPRDGNGDRSSAEAASSKSPSLLSARFHFRAIFGEAAFAGY